MECYEYKVQVVSLASKDKIEEICNKLGAKGWRFKTYKDGYLFFERVVVEG